MRGWLLLLLFIGIVLANPIPRRGGGRRGGGRASSGSSLRSSSGSKRGWFGGSFGSRNKGSRWASSKKSNSSFKPNTNSESQQKLNSQASPTTDKKTETKKRNLTSFLFG